MATYTMITFITAKLAFIMPTQTTSKLYNILANAIKFKNMQSQ